MSLRVMTEVWEHAPIVDARVLLTLLALADWSDDNGLSYPSVEHLALKSRQSERNCRYILRDLEGDGILKIARSTGRKKTNRYLINVERLRELFKLQVKSKKGTAEERVQGLQSLIHEKLQRDELKPATSFAAEPKTLEPSGVRASPFAEGKLQEALEACAEVLYLMYEKPKGPRAAKKAIVAALRRLMHGEHEKKRMDIAQAHAFLKERVEAYVAERERNQVELTFVPYPQKWFNGSRYLDGKEAAESRIMRAVIEDNAPLFATPAADFSAETRRLRQLYPKGYKS